MPESPIHQREHAVGEVVFFKEIGAVDLAFEEGIEVQDCRTAVSGVN